MATAEQHAEWALEIGPHILLREGQIAVLLDQAQVRSFANGRVMDGGGRVGAC